MKKRILSLVLLLIILGNTFSAFPVVANSSDISTLYRLSMGFEGSEEIEDCFEIIGSNSHRVNNSTDYILDDTIYVKQACSIRVVSEKQLNIARVADNISLEESFVGNTWEINSIGDRIHLSDIEFYRQHNIGPQQIKETQLKNGTYILTVSELGARSSFPIRLVVGNGIFAEPLSVYLNNNKINFDVDPIIEDERTLVPVRAIFEAMGIQVGWDSTTSTITATGNGNSISMQVNNTTATVNGKTITMDVSPKIIDNRTLVPVRFIAESLGAEVAWNETERRVDITTPGEKQIHISAINCERYSQEGITIWIQPYQYVFLDVVDTNGLYVDPSYYTIESNNPYIKVDEYKTLSIYCDAGNMAQLYLKDANGKYISNVNVSVVNDVATRYFAVNNEQASQALIKTRSYDLWRSFQENHGIKWGIAAVYQFYQDPVAYIGNELNYQKQVTAVLMDALTSDRALEILQTKIEQEYIDNWYEITTDIYEIGGEDISDASKKILDEQRNKLVKHQNDMLKKRALAYDANNGKSTDFDIYEDDVIRNEAIVKEIDWTNRELEKTKVQLEDITKSEAFLKKYNLTMDALDALGRVGESMAVSSEQKQMIVALQDVKEQYKEGLSLFAQQTLDPYFKNACLEAIEYMDMSLEEAQIECYKKGFEHFVGEGLKETIEDAVEKFSISAVQNIVKLVMTKYGASAEAISNAVGSVGKTAGMYGKAKIAAQITAGVCNFFGSTSDSIRASLDLKTLLTMETEMSAINSSYLQQIANGTNKIEEYVATAEVLKAIMTYACGLTNTIYNAEMNNRWDIFVRAMQGEEGYDDDYDRMYENEINQINNIQFILY